MYTNVPGSTSHYWGRYNGGWLLQKEALHFVQELPENLTFIKGFDKIDAKTEVGCYCPCNTSVSISVKPWFLI